MPATTTNRATFRASASTRRCKRGDDPLHILPYLSSLGIMVETLEDLLLINREVTEEEISAFRVAEGIAVVIASDGLWQLFEPGAAP